MNTDLNHAIDQAFNRGENQKGLKLLRELSTQHPESAETLYRLGVVEEQIGNINNAAEAYLSCVALAPQNPLAHLYCAYCLENLKRNEEALALYYQAYELRQDITTLWARNNVIPETRTRSKSGDLALRNHFSKLHSESVGDDTANKRVQSAIWTRTHNKTFHFKKTQQQPQVFYIPELPAIPHTGCSQWQWAEKIERNVETIKKELLAALPKILPNGRPYLPKGMKVDDNLSPLVGSLNWTALDLFRDGKPSTSILPHFSNTLALLEEAPLFKVENTPFEAFFSVLKPRQHITSHFGLSNHCFTVHLPIIIPEQCKIRIADEWLTWEEGKLIAFDDTFSHEAINNSDQDRIVLIFSIWRPELSSSEREAINRSFQTRNQWITNSKKHLPKYQ